MRAKVSKRGYIGDPGFTLVEVMIALLILALAMTALQFRITQHVNNSTYLRDKTVASWVAQNQLELLRLESRLDNIALAQPRSGIVTMAGKQWYWQATPGQSQQNNRIAPLLITVSENVNRDSPLVSLSGVSDAWHRLQ